MRWQHIRPTAVLAITVLGLVGCGQPMTNQQMGTVTGGVIGGVIGSRLSDSNKTATTIGGALIGSMVGAHIGRQADIEAQQEFSHALGTLPLKHTQSWRDQGTGYQYTITPTRTFHRGKHLCRRYKTSVLIDGKLTHAEGRACRDANGVWHIVD